MMLLSRKLLVVVAALSLSATACEKKTKSGAAASASAEENPDNKEGGCPCGCDKSEAMVASLELAGDDTARGAVAFALDTIAEREDAGYITEAMVEHRLRLRSTRPEVTSPAHGSRPPGTTAENASVRLGTELIVHGETTERIHGRDKLLRSCFLLRMEIENRSDEDQSFEPPVIEANMSLPVSRWYLAGTDGEPWDGKVRAGDKKLVHVIGYTGKPIAPGTTIDASVTFAALAVDTHVRARSRWDDVN